MRRPTTTDAGLLPCGCTATPSVVLVGHPGDEHSDHLETILEERSRVKVVRVSAADMVGTDVVWTPDRELTVGGHKVEPHHASGLWRRPGWMIGAGYSPGHRGFVESECRDATLGAWESLGIRWITPPSVLSKAELKLVQLEAAHRIGLSIPDTLVTNSPDAGIALARSVGRVVAKPIRYGLVEVGPPPLFAWTTEVDIAELRHLAGPPVILQRLVAARAHLRVTTVASTVFVSVLLTRDLDWRANLGNHDLFRAAKPNEYPGVEIAAEALAKELGLGFSTQDWIAGADGVDYFLEANPSGQWAFLEHADDSAIGTALAKELERTAAFCCSKP